MDVILSIYNFLLLVLFCVPLSIALIGYLQTKRPIFLATCLLFAFYIADNLVIYMTEVIDWFSANYDLKFMTVPAFKTLVYAGTFICLIEIIQHYLKAKTPVFIYCLLALILAVLLFIPLLPNSAMKVWCYYFPCQVFTFIVGIYTLNIMKNQPHRQIHPDFTLFRKLALLTVVFSILIVIEDTIVIFNFDTYTDLMVKINNRSLTEDILSIIYAIFAVRILVPLFQVSTEGCDPDPISTVAADTPKPEPVRQQAPAKEIEPPETPDEEISRQDSLTDENDIGQLPAKTLSDIGSADDYSKFFLFCREYQLTTREQDIFRELLKNKNNTEISEVLFISLGTVKAHVHNIFSKLEVSKRQQLIDKYDAFQADGENL